jgi:hypothetical protein
MDERVTMTLPTILEAKSWTARTFNGPEPPVPEPVEGRLQRFPSLRLLSLSKHRGAVHITYNNRRNFYNQQL